MNNGEHKEWITEKDMTLLCVIGSSSFDPSGWFVSEKYDGCRAYWDGSRFWTRNGNIVDAPEWFTKDLPNQHLDGEIWAGRGCFTEARLAVQYGKFTKNIRFMVFDAPRADGNWAERMRCVGRYEFAEPVDFHVCAGTKELFAEMEFVQQAGGEGLVVRSPLSTRYETGRSINSLKVKEFHEHY